MVPPENISGRLGNKMFQISYLYSQFLDGKIPNIYLQDEKYFVNHKEEIKKLFGLGISSRQEVGIHCRRGDYVENPFYVDLTKTDYYEKAIKLFPLYDKFLVFSDDIEFCKTYFTKEKFGKDFTFSEGNDEVTDLNYMASCAHQIMANSSFSWWASYLNMNPRKMIVAPSVANWHPDGVERTVCPNNWLRI